MIYRELEKILRKAAQKYPVISIMGPRQSGKTTLAKAVFASKKYVSLENPQTRSFAEQDPQGFLNQYPQGAIIDEVQRVPSLFSYIQTLVDERKEEGLYILTGSQNFGLMENVTQSLAGRVSINRLLPFSLRELQEGNVVQNNLNVLLFTGGYPRIYDKALEPTDWLGNYIETYLERDVRSLKNVGDLSSFHTFLRMCAARSGQLLNLSSLASDCGITHNTAKAWLSVLEASFLVFLLRPHYKNFNKRLKKSPKLYFLDTGLLCALVGITKSEELATHSMRGAIFETWVISEVVKMHYHKGKPLNIYFWQDKLGREIDCIMEVGEKMMPIEVKSGQTVVEDYWKNLTYWKQLAGQSTLSGTVVYAGDEGQIRKTGTLLPWHHLYKMVL